MGSGNFDSRSLDLDLEINVAVIDAAFVEELSGHFLEDQESSSEIDVARWTKRSLRTRAAENATEVIRQSL